MEVILLCQLEIFKEVARIWHVFLSGANKIEFYVEFTFRPFWYIFHLERLFVLFLVFLFLFHFLVILVFVFAYLF